MIISKQTAKQIAELLLQIKAIKLNSKNSFTWASGWKSPIYCDNRLLLSYPDAREIVKNAFVNGINEHFEKPDYIAGVATGAIAIGALVADALKLPFIYIRPEPKKHGRQNLIEGFIEAENKVIVVEDLISTGGSSLQAIKALKEENINVLGMMAIFNYGFKIADDNFKSQNINYYTLSNYTELLDLALSKSYITTTELDLLQKWNKNPQDWK